MPDGNDVMNQMIRQGRSDPVDFTDHRAVNASIRAAAGRPPGADPVSVLGPPPLPRGRPGRLQHLGRCGGRGRPGPQGPGRLRRPLAGTAPPGGSRPGAGAVSAETRLAELEAEALVRAEGEPGGDPGVGGGSVRAASRMNSRSKALDPRSRAELVRVARERMAGRALGDDVPTAAADISWTLSATPGFS